jgi:hypothetical protein
MWNYPKLTSSNRVKAGRTDILFTQAPPGFDGAYHFAFNIPENQFHASKDWISSRLAGVREAPDGHRKPGTAFIYFKDAAGNVLEFIVSQLEGCNGYGFGGCRSFGQRNRFAF